MDVHLGFERILVLTCLLQYSLCTPYSLHNRVAPPGPNGHVTFKDNFHIKSQVHFVYAYVLYVCTLFLHVCTLYINRCELKRIIKKIRLSHQYKTIMYPGFL